MNLRLLIFSALCLCIPSVTSAQGLPPLGAEQPQKSTTAPTTGTLSVEAANADLKTARAANQEKRYADAETLMLKDTAARSDMPYLWIELGLAQLGEKKYSDAETSFKAALGKEDSAPKAGVSGGFYSADLKGTRSGISISDAPVGATTKRNPDVDGTSDAGLGEIYIHTNRIPEAKAAFDEAAKVNPGQAAFYFRNEAVFFLQVGKAPEQVEAANKAIGVDPTRAVLYFYKGQGLAAQATVDPTTQKLVLPSGCADALEKYLDLDPNGAYAADAKGMLAAAGVTMKPGKK